jgi:hypothetical protein
VSTTKRAVYPLLFGKEDIFQRLRVDEGDLDLQGWGGHREYFEERLLESSPSLVVEVGTWKGKSAVAMADILASQGRRCEVVCVDTWLGATEFWTNHGDQKRYGSLRLRNGYPQVYYTFLKNVLAAGHAGRITPFPQTSTNAARFFRRAGIQADLIYVDGSHDYEDVRADLEAWWPVLRGGGTMFGDDYCQYWSGVIRAVDEHAAAHGLLVHHRQYANGEGQAPSDYWRVVKP